MTFTCSCVSIRMYAQTLEQDTSVDTRNCNKYCFFEHCSVCVCDIGHLRSWRRTPDNGGKRNKTCWPDSVNMNMDSLEHQPWFFLICPWWVNNCYLLKLMLIIIIFVWPRKFRYYINGIVYWVFFLFPNRKVWLILYWDILDTGNWNLWSDHV